MRTPGFPRPARQAAFALVALVLGAGLPLTVGVTPALACGGDSRSTTTTTATTTAVTATTDRDTVPQGATVTGFVPVVPTGITAGGPKIEIGIEEANLSGAPMERVAPAFALYDEQAGNHGTGTMLRIEELSVEVMVHGRWTPLELHYGCDPVISADTTTLAEPLADGRAHRFVFRVGLSAQAPVDRTRIQVYSGVTRSGRLNAITLDVEHQAARPATGEPTPNANATLTTTTTDPVAPAAPVGATEAAHVVPLAGEPAAQASATPDTALLRGGLAVALLGAGATFLGVRRRSRN